jgi:hypothetical protein
MQALMAAAADGRSWEEVRRSLTELDPDRKDLSLEPFVLAFSYSLLERSGKRRERVGSPFGAMVAGEGWRFPPALSELDGSHLEAWVAALDETDDPVLNARLADLLFERRAGSRPDHYARRACDSLMQLVQRDDWSLMERARLTTRALELARAVGDHERVGTVIAQALAFVEADIESDSGGPGVSLMPLRSLVDLPVEERPSDLDDVLVRVQDRYGDDPYITDSVAELRARLLNQEDMSELRRQQVARWREEATKGDTMMRVFRLERALELAGAFGMKEEAEELRAELGEIKPGELDLKEISAEVEIPRAEVERFLSLFRSAPSWERGLDLLAAQPPPGGSPEDLEAQVDQIMTESPLQFLFSKAIIGPESAGAIFKATDPASHKRVALSEERARAAGFWALFAAEALDLVSQSFERPTHAALTEYFTGELIEPEVAERMARALEMYWDGEVDECAHLLVPRIERVIREMARRVGLPVFREPVGDKPGGVVGLGSLLHDVAGAFADPGWHAYLVVLLSDPLGMNLRNAISHGLLTRVGKPTAALLIQVACLLSTFGLTGPSEDPVAPTGAAPDPPSTAESEDGDTSSTS